MKSFIQIPASDPTGIPQQETTWSVGTLVYNKRQLVILFVWLMWNDFGITLMESIGSLNGVMMRDHGATFTQMAVLGSIGGFIAPWINPWVSTWSDRHRGPFGRRRPFLLIATPLFAFFLMATPFMPDFFHFLERFPIMARLFVHIPMNGPAFFIGMCGLVQGMFNAVVLAIFSYLYWDVVPENLMGRFNSLSKNVALIAGLIWSFFIFGLAENHMKEVYVGTGIFSLAIYILSVWKVKEGEYPPPDEHTKGGVFAPIRAYFVECFSESFYLWIFVASLFFQLGNAGGWYQFNFLHYDLKMDLSTLGWVDGWAKMITTGFGLVLGFAIGSMTDRLKPVRLMAPCFFVLAAVVCWTYFYVHDSWTYLISFTVRNLVMFVLTVIIGAFTVEVFPREKLGQFCSAQAIFYQLIVNMTAPLVGMLFDHLQNNRFGFLWMAGFYALSGLTYLKVYSNWRQRMGITPVPHAG